MSDQPTSKSDSFQPLSGSTLLLAGLVLAASNFMVVLDTTIANVSVPHIAGALGISATQGTWIITSYAVAEAICVPLTGWLAARFGTVRTFIWGMIGFGIFSTLCGMSTTLGMLVACRIGQGLCGGPMMPLSQTLLLRVFPPEKRGQAMAMWAMTTVTAPILGPILGGTISDNWSWHWIFFINIPVVAFCAFGAMRLLRQAETRLDRPPIDRMGLALMILWIGALQIMLDLGREHDWFGDPFIVMLAVIAAIGFAVFIVWEVTEHKPIVDLRVFRHRGFTVSTIALSFAFGTFFASVVILPQWLQQSLGYTATWAGYTTAFTGVGAVIMSPVVARLLGKVDPRGLVCFGVLWLGLTSLLRTVWPSDADFWTLAIPQMLQGIGMPFFFIPLTTIGLAAVEPDETASAAGIMAFMRTMAGAIGTSVATTAWDDMARSARSNLVGVVNTNVLPALNLTAEQARRMVEQLVDKESLAIATNHIFAVAAVIFFFSAMIIWLSPRPARAVDTSAAH
ncbi:DHA2 family efflux MFS transporter permease subunit [Sphingobium sp. H39-3-25]|uniref:DHA2 family efflux MFS transporter permease subunit n=1 Tax=Sphingobium arseniciresistens TaxID=3030834 RepID=UPI0023B8FF9D|nr:DHA2 family efflux MFS transporter permease subunit [Sphingobium arseniciresistens]